MPKVSVVMPSLNVIEYIKPCMESVIEQSLTDIEIICVDAGSDDGTLEVLREYANNDKRIKVIISEKKSYGYQMNLGISEAVGDYISIIETDDIVETDMLSALYERIKNTNAEYIKGQAQGFMDFGNNHSYRWDINNCYELIDNPELKEIEMEPNKNPKLFIRDNFLWYGLYRRDFLSKIKFHETPGAAFQDIPVLYKIISTAKQAIYIRKKVYNYRNSNIGASSFSRKSLNYTATEYKYLKAYAEELSKEWLYVYYRKMLLLTLDRYDYMAISGEYWKESEEGIKWLKENLFISKKAGDLILEELPNEAVERANRFIKDPLLALEIDKKTYASKKSSYLELLDKLIDKKIIIFGAGKLGEFIQALFNAHNLDNIICFCDNNKEIHETERYGYRVISPFQAVSKYKDDVFLIANVKNSESISNQLCEMGVKKENQIIFNMPIDRMMLFV